ncbi:MULTISPECIES: sugar phosphate isomerase/epimerase family protein [Nocardia]|uniref:sugar phosphate isomerase/epimerase family protein n=1 Tax=Nocardia TaxID=1817 RepID=UPI000BF03D1D|nr:MULTISPECIES: sugar phosphate isomerase/epimerase family protein [Nocardia]MBF6184215.1 sugar phosphate isomerase/epimerase [Nocardia farcinica]MBF6290677.1 sugar phosphate isomerase/epimerase [Nocardia farcinica]MBF6310059.1 sugar phosphate isomerase/epimerase [Nocardia farcinica]MBF6377850.1 sugar phosphate isomerase/epimerase [Nocardia farcinica]MBF6406119.1 sugar phosphate isomerase/epimerase [Nocardia farcinica]
MTSVAAQHLPYDLTDPYRSLSLNTATTKRWTLAEAVDGAARAGLGAIGLWRDRVQEIGVAAAAKLVADAGLRVSSLCRGGFLTAPGDGQSALDDNRRAIDEAAALGTRELVMVMGGIADRDLAAARARVEERLALLVPYAAERGVRLALEPLHPMFCADRAVISTLAQALTMARPYPAETVGVVVDTFHLWWDPLLEDQIAQAGAEGRISSYQVCDWLNPMAADPLLSRGMMGDGVVDFATIGGWVRTAGYRGDVEVEIFNAAVWEADGHSVIETMKQRYRELVLPALVG